jgi:hypothetical protein
MEKKTPASMRANNPAGRAGFEPAVEVSPDNHLAGGPNQPLWHLPDNSAQVIPLQGGGRGIRTPGGRKPTAVFKTAALVHSAIPPLISREIPPGRRDFITSIHAAQQNAALGSLAVLISCYT